MLSFPIKCERDYTQQYVSLLSEALIDRDIQQGYHAIECGQHEENAVETVHKTAVSRHYLSVVLEAYLSLYH